MTNVVKLDFLFTKADHESPRVELHVLLVYRCWENVVVVQIFSFSFLRLSLALATLRLRWHLSGYHSGRLRQLTIENCVRLSIVQPLAFLVVHAGSKEVNTLVVEVYISEALEVH